MVWTVEASFNNLPMKNTILPSCLSYTASTCVKSSGRLYHNRLMSAGYPAYRPLVPNLHVYLPLKKNVSFRMIDTASKDVLQKSGLSASTAGTLGRSVRLGGTVLPVVITVVGVVVEAVVVEAVVVVMVVLVLTVDVEVGRSGFWEDGLYTGMSPHILSFFEPTQKIQITFNTFVSYSYKCELKL